MRKRATSGTLKALFLLRCIGGLLSLTTVPVSIAFVPPSTRQIKAFYRYYPPQKLYSSDTSVNNDSEESAESNNSNENNDGESRKGLGGVFSKVKRLAKKGSTKVQSVATATGQGVQSAAGGAAATSNQLLSTLAEKGSSNVKSAAGVVSSGLTGLGDAAWSSTRGLTDALNRTRSDATGEVVQLSAGDGTVLSSRLLSEFVEKGSSNVKSAAGAVASGLLGLGDAAMSSTRGLTDAVNRTRLDATELLQRMNGRAKEGASAADKKAKSLILSFTGKQDYQFGDIVKEVLRRAMSTAEKINIQDVMLVLRILLTLGASFTPLAKLIPVTVLLEMLNTSLEAQLGGKILEVLASALDSRFQSAFKAEELGDFAKRSLTAAIIAFTGKETYQSGDIEKAVKEIEGDTNKEGAAKQQATTAPTESAMTSEAPKTFQLMVGPEFEEWDRAFRATQPDFDQAFYESLSFGGSRGGISKKELEISKKELDTEFVSELDEWDRMFRKMYPDAKL